MKIAKSNVLLALATFGATLVVSPETSAASLTINTRMVKTETAANMFGTGMEDVNHEIYGGLDAQRLFGESFEEPNRTGRLRTYIYHGVSSSWEKSDERDGGEFELSDDVSHWGKRSQLLLPNGGSCAIANRGLCGWGIPTVSGRKMSGHVFVRGKVDALTVGLQDRDGAANYAIADIPTVGTDNWSKVEFTLAPTKTDAHARFFIRASGIGKVWVDDVYLADEPTNEFGRIGCREDIAAAFGKEKVNFLRWGGTMVNVPDYCLKNMRGNGERRPYPGWWYPESSGGFGPYEFVKMSAKMKLPCAVSISRDESVEDAVAFANKIAEYDIPICVEIGNEEGVPWFNEENIEFLRKYCANVRRLVEPMRAANPKLTFASAAWWSEQKADWMEEVFKATDGVVEYWDIHVVNGSIEEARRNAAQVKKVMEMWRKWNPKTTMKIAVFEENGRNHDVERALATAITAMGIRELGLDVLTCCGANALQPYLMNDNWWNQGQIFFTPDKVWLQPYGWAKRMGAKSHRELLIESQSDDADVLLSSTRSRDGSSVVLHVVNVADERKRLAVAGLEGYRLVTATELSGRLKADNPVDNTDAVEPREITAQFEKTPSISPYSYTVLEYATAL